MPCPVQALRLAGCADTQVCHEARANVVPMSREGHGGWGALQTVTVLENDIRHGAFPCGDAVVAPEQPPCIDRQAELLIVRWPANPWWNVHLFEHPQLSRVTFEKAHF